MVDNDEKRIIMDVVLLDGEGIELLDKNEKPKNLFEDMLTEPKSETYKLIYQDKARFLKALKSSIAP